MYSSAAPAPLPSAPRMFDALTPTGNGASLPSSVPPVSSPSNREQHSVSSAHNALSPSPISSATAKHTILQLQRFFESHSFDTAGQYSDLFNVLLSCCKHMVDVGLLHHVALADGERDRQRMEREIEALCDYSARCREQLDGIVGGLDTSPRPFPSQKVLNQRGYSSATAAVEASSQVDEGIHQEVDFLRSLVEGMHERLLKSESAVRDLEEQCAQLQKRLYNAEFALENSQSHKELFHTQLSLTRKQAELEERVGKLQRGVEAHAEFTEEELETLKRQHESTARSVAQASALASNAVQRVEAERVGEAKRDAEAQNHRQAQLRVDMLTAELHRVLGAVADVICASGVDDADGVTSIHVEPATKQRELQPHQPYRRRVPNTHVPGPYSTASESDRISSPSSEASSDDSDAATKRKGSEGTPSRAGRHGWYPDVSRSRQSAGTESTYTHTAKAAPQKSGKGKGGGRRTTKSERSGPESHREAAPFADIVKRLQDAWSRKRDLPSSRLDELERRVEILEVYAPHSCAMAAKPPLLGLELTDVEGDYGVRVTRVFEGYAGMHGGVRTNDVILAVNGFSVASRAELYAVLSEMAREKHYLHAFQRVRGADSGDSSKGVPPSASRPPQANDASDPANPMGKWVSESARSAEQAALLAVTALDPRRFDLVLHIKRNDTLRALELTAFSGL